MRCAHCERPIGLSSKTTGMLWWSAQLCSDRCLKGYLEEDTLWDLLVLRLRHSFNSRPP